MTGPLDAATAEEFRQRLRQAREELLRAVALTAEELATLEGHLPGAPSEDAGTEAAADTLARLEGRKRRDLDEIVAALRRLDLGTFGVCEGCGEAIALVRLRAMPAARRCVPCQEREEQGGGLPGVE